MNPIDIHVAYRFVVTGMVRRDNGDKMGDGSPGGQRCLHRLLRVSKV